MLYLLIQISYSVRIIYLTMIKIMSPITISKNCSNRTALNGTIDCVYALYICKLPRREKENGELV